MASQEQCVATQDFDGLVSEGELSFREGDVITVTEKDGTHSGWWRGFVSKSASFSEQAPPSISPLLFPNCLVLPKTSKSLKAAHSAFTDRALLLMDLTVGGTTFPAATVFRLVGLAPERAMLFGVPDAGSNSSLPSTPVPLPGNLLSCRLARVVYAFQSRAPHELSVSPGEVLLVSRQWDDGWWEGRKTADSPGGIFPGVFAVNNHPSVMPALFCGQCYGILCVTTPPGESCAPCSAHARIQDMMLRNLLAWNGVGRIDLFASVSAAVFSPTDSSLI